MSGASAARLDRHRATLESLASTIAARQEESRRALADAEAAWAGPARRGEWGPDWQRLQRRLDAGETTLRGVFDGTDDDPSSRRLAARSRSTLAGLASASERLPDEQREQLHHEAAAAESQWQALLDRAGEVGRRGPA